MVLNKLSSNLDIDRCFAVNLSCRFVTVIYQVIMSFDNVFGCDKTNFPWILQSRSPSINVCTAISILGNLPGP